MSRRRFLRTVGAAAAGVGAASVGLGGTAKAALPFGELADDGYYDVYPMNDPQVDMLNVQLAVLGLEILPDLSIGPIEGFTGIVKVRLKSTAYGTDIPTPFDFSGINTLLSLPCVILLAPVEIVGDGFDAEGTPKTVINGGGGSSYIGPLAALTLMLEEYGPVRIHGLSFHGQRLGAIGGFSFFGLEITNNDIINMESETATVFGNYGDYRMAIFLTRANMPGWPDDMPPPWPENPPNVLIKDNFIDNSNAMNQPEILILADLGIAAAGLYDTAEYLNNTVQNRGIPLELNCNLGPSNTIHGNKVRTKMRDFQDAGIWAMCHYGESRITNNDITLLPEAGGCGFMLSNPQGAYEISGNRLTMSSGFAAFHMGDPGFCFVAVPKSLAGAVIKNNHVSGTASNAFVAMDYPEVPEFGLEAFQNDSNHNVIVGNNMAGFVPTGGYPFPLPPIHVFLDAHTYANDLRGYFGGQESVLDLNPFGPYADQPNFISGYTKKGSGGVGSGMSQAMTSKAAHNMKGMADMASAMAIAAKAAAGKLGSL